MRRPRREGASREPVPVGDALRELGRELGMPEPGALTELLAVWPDLVGPVVGQHARPRALVDGVLTVAVDDPAWATEVRYLEAELCRRAEDRVGAGVVRAVRVVVRPAKPEREGRGLVD